MGAFMLNLFEKDYRQNFRMMLSCHSLTLQAFILGQTNAVNNIYDLLNHVFFVLKCFSTGQGRNKHNKMINKEKKRKEKKMKIIEKMKNNKKNKNALLATIKQKHITRNGALQITFCQLLNNTHYEKHAGQVGKEFFLYVFVLFIF